MKRLPFKPVMAVPGASGKVGTSGPDFRSKFPLGTIPAIEDPGSGTCLSESSAILTYLADAHGWSDLYPTDRLVRSKVDEYLHWHHSGTRALAKAHFAPRARPDLKVKPEAAAAAAKQAETSLDLLEGAFLGRQGGGGFVAGTNAPTVADFLAYSEVASLGPRYGKLLDFSERPHTAQWLDGMSKVPYHDEIFKSLEVLGDLRDGATGADGALLPPVTARLAPATKVGLVAINAAIAK